MKLGNIFGASECYISDINGKSKNDVRNYRHEVTVEMC